MKNDNIKKSFHNYVTHIRTNECTCGSWTEVYNLREHDALLEVFKFSISFLL